MMDHNDNSVFITASQMRDLVGGINPVTEWRWLNDDALNFPKPSRINNRKYYKRSAVLEWLEAMACE